MHVLTFSSSVKLHSIVITRLFCSQIILQKSLTVDFSGPWVAMNDLRCLYPYVNDNVCNRFVYLCGSNYHNLYYCMHTQKVTQDLHQ